MAPDRGAVDKDRGGTVDRTEMQNDAPAPPTVRDAERFPVPQVVHESLFAYSRKLGFDAIRHADLPIRLAAQRDFPFPVQQEKLVPRELRFGIAQKFFQVLFHVLLSFL